MISSIRSYIDAVKSQNAVWRTLRGIEPLCDATGEPLHSVGNSAVVFKVQYDGRIRKLRCYIRPKHSLRAIYRERYYSAELLVAGSMGRCEWADVVLEEWCEGDTLQVCIERALGDGAAMHALAMRFERFALWLLGEEWAHGDLKPDNMVVTEQGEMRLIDFDAIYSPRLEGMACEELGSRNYQHPDRGLMQCKALDDYPSALIATGLHALALEGTLTERYSIKDAMLIDTKLAVKGCDAALDEIERLFARHGDAIHYRMARLLRQPSVALPSLGELLAGSTTPPDPTDEPLEADCQGGRWGYRTAERFVIPPLYDEAFDFSEGLGAVRLGDVWHFIETTGRAVISCEGCERVKPFRNGTAVKIQAGRRITIDHSGREL